MKRYRALTGMNYKPEGAEEEVRRERGDDVSDLPETAIPSLLANNPPSIEEYEPDNRGRVPGAVRTRKPVPDNQ